MFHVEAVHLLDLFILPVWVFFFFGVQIFVSDSAKQMSMAQGRDLSGPGAGL